MNNHYQRYNNIPKYIPNNNDNRFVGGFLGPFLLGGITGGLLAPAFYPRPIYGPVLYPPYPVYQRPYYQNNYPIY